MIVYIKRWAWNHVTINTSLSSFIFLFIIHETEK